MTANFNSFVQSNFTWGGGAGTFTVSGLQVSGSNLHMIVGVSYTYSPVDSNAVARYGNSNMAFLTNLGGNGQQAHVQAFSLFGPRTDITNLVVSNMLASTENGIVGILTATNTTNTLGVAAFASNNSTGSEVSNEVTLTGTTVGSLIVDCHSIQSQPLPYSEKAGQTSRGTGTNIDSGFAMSTKAGPGGDTNMGWTWTTSDDNALFAIEILSAAVPATNVAIVGMG